jgi:predicted aminopeptidase
MRHLVLLLLLCTGCLTVHAALQSAEGELTLLASRKPVAEVIANPNTRPRLRGLLLQIDKVKRFGEENGLKPTDNYQDYVQLHRSAVVYVVSACEPLRFVSKTWSFPVAGDFPYLGWFDLRSARDYAGDLKSEGWDVDLRGATAYSTLGWFHDPVLSSMIGPGPEALGDLVDVVLHESVHATLHLEGQALFNESLASFVADRLTPRYLASAPRALEAWEEQQRRGEAASIQLHAAYVELKQLYDSNQSDDEKRARKAAVLQALQQRLQMRAITNATLVQHQTYSSGGQGFARVLEACGGDAAGAAASAGAWRCFFDRLRRLTPESFARPHQEDLDSVLLPLAR